MDNNSKCTIKLTKGGDVVLNEELTRIVTQEVLDFNRLITIACTLKLAKNGDIIYSDKEVIQVDRLDYDEIITVGAQARCPGDNTRGRKVPYDELLPFAPYLAQYFTVFYVDEEGDMIAIGKSTEQMDALKHFLRKTGEKGGNLTLVSVFHNFAGKMVHRRVLELVEQRNAIMMKVRKICADGPFEDADWNDQVPIAPGMDIAGAIDGSGRFVNETGMNDECLLCMPSTSATIVGQGIAPTNSATNAVYPGCGVQECIVQMGGNSVVADPMENVVEDLGKKKETGKEDATRPYNDGEKWFNTGDPARDAALNNFRAGFNKAGMEIRNARAAAAAAFNNARATAAFNNANIAAAAFNNASVAGAAFNNVPAPVIANGEGVSSSVENVQPGQTATTSVMVGANEPKGPVLKQKKPTGEQHQVPESAIPQGGTNQNFGPYCDYQRQMFNEQSLYDNATVGGQCVYWPASHRFTTMSGVPYNSYLQGNIAPYIGYGYGNVNGISWPMLNGIHGNAYYVPSGTNNVGDCYQLGNGRVAHLVENPGYRNVVSYGNAFNNATVPNVGVGLAQGQPVNDRRNYAWPRYGNQTRVPVQPRQAYGRYFDPTELTPQPAGGSVGPTGFRNFDRINPAPMTMQHQNELFGPQEFMPGTIKQHPRADVTQPTVAATAVSNSASTASPVGVLLQTAPAPLRPVLAASSSKENAYIPVQGKVNVRQVGFPNANLQGTSETPEQLPKGQNEVANNVSQTTQTNVQPTPAATAKAARKTVSSNILQSLMNAKGTKMTAQKYKVGFQSQFLNKEKEGVEKGEIGSTDAKVDAKVVKSLKHLSIEKIIEDAENSQCSQSDNNSIATSSNGQDIHNDECEMEGYECLKISDDLLLFSDKGFKFEVNGNSEFSVLLTVFDIGEAKRTLVINRVEGFNKYLFSGLVKTYTRKIEDASYPGKSVYEVLFQCPDRYGNYTVLYTCDNSIFKLMVKVITANGKTNLMPLKDERGDQIVGGKGPNVDMYKYMAEKEELFKQKMKDPNASTTQEYEFLLQSLYRDCVENGIAGSEKDYYNQDSSDEDYESSTSSYARNTNVNVDSCTVPVPKCFLLDQNSSTETMFVPVMRKGDSWSTSKGQTGVVNSSEVQNGVEISVEAKEMDLSEKVSSSSTDIPTPALRNKNRTSVVIDRIDISSDEDLSDIEKTFEMGPQDTKTANDWFERAIDVESMLGGSGKVVDSVNSKEFEDTLKKAKEIEVDNVPSFFPPQPQSQPDKKEEGVSSDGISILPRQLFDSAMAFRDLVSKPSTKPSTSSSSESAKPSTSSTNESAKQTVNDIYKEALNFLSAVGFGDQFKNSVLLERFHGDVNRVLDELLCNKNAAN